MKHFTVPSFWDSYEKLPLNIKSLADKNFELLKKKSHHPSLHLKRVGHYWSARIGMKYRALAVEIEHGLLWFWIGHHTEYDTILKNP